MRLHLGTRMLEIALIVFDKDGTLVDLHAPWGDWAERVAARLAPYLAPAPFLHLLGWDTATSKVMPETPLAIASASTTEAVVATWLYQTGLGWSAAMVTAREALQQPEVVPAPPLRDLLPIFQSLRDHQIRVAVVTTDSQQGVERDLGPLGLLPLVDAVVTGDDRLATKPAPDMLLRACATAGVEPARTIVVGDSLADLMMGRAADVGARIGVATGASPPEVLAPHADLVLPSIAELLPTLETGINA